MHNYYAWYMTEFNNWRDLRNHKVQASQTSLRKGLRIALNTDPWTHLPEYLFVSLDNGKRYLLHINLSKYIIFIFIYITFISTIYISTDSSTQIRLYCEQKLKIKSFYIGYAAEYINLYQHFQIIYSCGDMYLTLSVKF